MRRTRRVGFAVIAVVFALTVVLFSGLHRKPFEGGKRTVVAEFERAAQLNPGSEVRLEGNIEGKVKSVAATPDGRAARVTLEVDESAGEIYADATARVRALTLLAGKFYVEIDRGSSAAGALGGRVIDTDHTSVQVEVEDLTDVFREGAFSGLQTLPKEMGDALADPTAPTAAIDSADRVVGDVEVAADAVRGLLPGSDLPQLIVQGAKTTGALYSGNDDLRTLVSGAAATLETTARRNQEVRDTIAASPSVAYDLDTTLGRLDRTLTLTNGLVERLEIAAPTVAPALARLHPALDEVNQLLPNLPRLLTQTGLTLDGLDHSGRGGEAIRQLRPTLKTLVTNLRDLTRPDPITEKPTSTMIGGAMAGLGGIAAFQDPMGHYVRFPATGAAEVFYIPCKSSLINLDTPELLACDSFNEALQTYLGSLPAGPELPSARGKGER